MDGTPLLFASGASSDPMPLGVVEGHVKILSLKEVGLAGGNPQTKVAPENVLSVC